MPHIVLNGNKTNKVFFLEVLISWYRHNNEHCWTQRPAAIKDVYHLQEVKPVETLSRPLAYRVCSRAVKSLCCSLKLVLTVQDFLYLCVPLKKTCWCKLLQHCRIKHLLDQTLVRMKYLDITSSWIWSLVKYFQAPTLVNRYRRFSR